MLGFTMTLTLPTLKPFRDAPQIAKALDGSEFLGRTIKAAAARAMIQALPFCNLR